MNAINTYFIDVIKNHYFDFNGRATRTQFWLYVLFRWLLGLLVYFILVSLIGGKIGSILWWTFYLALELPFLGIAARRLHDIGRSGWWLIVLYLPFLMYILPAILSMLILFATLIGVIVLFVFFLLPSKK